MTEQQGPCSRCGYGGKHLEAPPCTTCPAHPKEAENNAPLTLDELREMDGEPVWVIPLAPEEQPEWALVDVMEEWLCTSNADYWGFEVYGKCILAYRHKLEEGK